MGGTTSVPVCGSSGPRRPAQAPRTLRTAFGEAPASSNVAIISLQLLTAVTASIKAVEPHWHRIRSRTRRSGDSGQCPHKPRATAHLGTSAQASTSEPPETSTCSTSPCPSFAASMRGVKPACKSTVSLRRSVPAITSAHTHTHTTLLVAHLRLHVHQSAFIHHPFAWLLRTTSGSVVQS